MSKWPSTKAQRVLIALNHIGWEIKCQSGSSHRVLTKSGWLDFVFSFHEQEEIGSKMLARIGEKTGLTPKDL